MTASTTIIRLAKAFALTLAVAAFAAPVALANDGLVDDWFRDAPYAVQATPLSPYTASDRIVDDYFRDGNRVPQTSIGLVDDSFRDAPLATLPASRGVSDRIVDDYFRDGNRVPQTSIGLIDTSFRDAPAAALPAASGVTDRIVDDWFRDASRVTAPQTSPGGFSWGDFGIGAAAMLGLVLLLAGLGIGALAVRHKGGQLRTS